MMKKLLILLLLLPDFANAKLQGKALIDSMVKEFTAAKSKNLPDTSKVLLLKRISMEYSHLNPDEGIKYSMEGLKLAERLGWKKGMGRCYNSLFANYRAKSEFETALEYAGKELELTEESGDKRGVSNCLGNMALIYQEQGKYTKALELQFRDLKLSEDLNDSTSIAAANMNIGATYFEIQNSAKSLQYLQLAERIFEKIDDQRGSAMVLTNIGTIYNEQRKYDTCVEYQVRALNAFEVLGDKASMVVCIGNIASGYQAMGRHAKAVDFAFRGLKMAEELGDNYNVGLISCIVGATYLDIANDSLWQPSRSENRIPKSKQQDLALAIEYLQKGVDIFKKLSEFKFLTESYQKLVDACTLSGDYKAALKYYEAYSSAHDSVFSADNKIKIANLSTQRETDLKEKQIEVNRLQDAGKKKERTLYIIGLGLLGIIIVLIFRNYSRQRKTSASLGVANTQLAKEKTKSDELAHRQGELLLQKDVLMKEIHHRVKNNLQVISTLLDLQLATVSDEGARDAMTESTTRVKSISLIHQQLYQNEDLTTIEFAKFARDLHFQINSVFRQTGRKIVLQNDIPEILLDIDTAVPLGLILNELMTNSYKYAFTGDDSGTIKISIVKKDDVYELAYKDSGPGLPVSFNPETTKSLGIRVVRSLSKQLGGKFTYDYAGKLFLITFKDLEGRKMED